jgi:hypothetical protein
MAAALLVAGGVLASWVAGAGSSTPKFLPDDPIQYEPETQDASNTPSWLVSDDYDDFQHTLFGRGKRVDARALNVNTMDEVPNSGWFTNRIVGPDSSFAASVARLIQSLGRESGPAPGPWTIVEGKPEGIQPGFVVADSTGQRYFVKFDPPSNPEMASGAEVISTRFFHLFGYYVPENFIARIRTEELLIDEHATIRRNGRIHKFTQRDVKDILRRAARSGDGSYRLMASKQIAGRPIGPFRYYSTRPDDPNDIFPHEHRRELRGMRVLAAWLNHHDVGSSNTFDTVIDVGGRQVVRHYLLDFGATLGSGSIEAQKRRAGNEFLWEARPTLLSALTLGLYVRPWITVDYPDLPALGRIEGDHFEPEGWKPDHPIPAFKNSREDDTFWAARRVAAFTDEIIRTIVKTAEFGDVRCEDHLVEVLIKRRNKVLQRWLTDVNPLVDFALDSGGVLTFRNAAVDAQVASAPSEHIVRWARFDNQTGLAEAFTGELRTPESRLQAPPDLLASAEFLLAEIGAAHPEHTAWSHPVRVYFRRHDSGWETVGLERLPDPATHP